MARKAKFFQEVYHGHLTFCGKQQKELYDAWVSHLKDRQVIEMTLEKRRHAKTNPQLAYWYAVLMPFATDELRNAGHDELFNVAVGDLQTGVETNTGTVDLLFKVLFKEHKQLDEMPLKRDMSDEEMGQLIDFTMMWLAKNLGAVAPQPERTHECQTTTKSS